MAKNKKTEKIREKFDLGTLYQKTPGGIFFFRYQINKSRKSISLKTKDYETAKEKVLNYLPTIRATSLEVIAAHVNEARSLEAPREQLFLSDAWEQYSKQPDRATPATVSEQLSYETTFKDFVNFLDKPLIEIHQVTHEDALAFAEHLKKQELAVDTHNRKIKRLRKIFNVLKDYCHKTSNPFLAPTLLRKSREEQNQGVRRLAFTREQEQQLLRVLDDPKKKVMHKPEIKIIYYLGMYTGQRMKDCIMLRWNRINFQRRTIEVKQFKTGKEVTIPIAPQLYDVLLEAQATKKNDHDFVCPNVAERYSRKDSRGKNVGNNLVNIDVLRVIKWIGLEPSVKVEGRKKAVTVYGFHSLRHSFASHCAEAGVPKAVVLSILGTESDIVDKYYTHIGEEAQHKAMAVIAGEIGMLSPQDRIDRALKYMETLASTDELLEIKRLLVERQ
jgi:integrase